MLWYVGISLYERLLKPFFYTVGKYKTRKLLKLFQNLLKFIYLQNTFFMYINVTDDIKALNLIRVLVRLNNFIRKELQILSTPKLDLLYSFSVSPYQILFN